MDEQAQTHQNVDQNAQGLVVETNSEQHPITYQPPEFEIVGRLVGTCERGGQLQFGDTELKPIFQGGIHGLPPYQQLLSQEEWKAKLQKQLQDKKRNMRKKEIARIMATNLPDQRRTYELIPDRTLRYRIPKEMNVHAKSKYTHLHIVGCVQQQILTYINNVPEKILSKAEKEIFLRFHGPRIQITQGQVFLDILWSTQRGIPSLLETQLSCDGHVFMYAGHGSLHDKKWMTIQIEMVPTCATVPMIYEALQNHLQDTAYVREIWEIYTQTAEVTRKGYNFLCLIEVDLEAFSSISLEHRSWLAQIYGFIKIGDSNCELNFLRRSPWCITCKDDDEGERHLYPDCPYFICKFCGKQGHEDRQCFYRSQEKAGESSRF